MVDAQSGARSTGVELLDDALGGGVPPGSLVALAATPRAQSEPLLYQMAAENRTRYLSTLRPAAEVTDAIAATVGTGGEDRVDPTAGVDVRAVDGDDVLAEPEPHFSGLESGSVVVVDPTTELEQGERERYRQFLDTCKHALRMTDSDGLLHCHENTPSVLRRDVTMARADLVWDVRVDAMGGRLHTRMAITKARGGSPAGMFDLRFDDGGVTARDCSPGQ
ncbi:MAG: RAD55 family ATPase [Haloarculaceae archaeon]